MAPSAGPTISTLVVSADEMNPLALARPLAGTRLGSAAWLAAANRVSPTPIRKTTTSSSGNELRSTTMSSPKITRITARAASTAARRRRRSMRSAIAPAGRETRSHGRRLATVTSATSRASSVLAAASKGKATKTRPSPRPEMPMAVRKVQKRAGNRFAVWGGKASIISVRAISSQESDTVRAGTLMWRPPGPNRAMCPPPGALGRPVGEGHTMVLGLWLSVLSWSLTSS